MDMVTRIERTQQMGGEFLTWLWYRSELNEGVLQVGERPIEVWFDAKLALESLGAIKEQNVIRSETPTETEEARASLQSGRVRLDDDAWRFEVEAMRDWIHPAAS